jgi:hypothetical protein
MAFLTTNPSPFLINVPELQNVQTSATGAGGLATLQNSINDILTYINTANSQININTIGSSSTGSVTFSSNINLSNSEITFLGSNLLSSNALNGPANFIAFQVNSVEQARLTTTGLGLGTTAPFAKLHVEGSAYISSNLGIGVQAPLLPLDLLGGAIVRGPLYVSSFGAVSSQTGNIITTGDIFAQGFFYPSDPTLKTNIRSYAPVGLPRPVEFDWIRNGERDIGVLADEVERLEPVCVTRAPNGSMTVDYPKLTVLLLAEVQGLKEQMSTVMARLPV